MKKPAVKKTKLSKKSKTNKQSDLAMYAVVSAIVVAGLGFLMFSFQLTKADHLLGRYRAIAKSTNQACNGLRGNFDIKGLETGFTINEAADAKQTVSFYCHTGQVVQQATIQGKTVPEYDMGVKVWYFQTSGQAYDFGEKLLNPLRFWGVDQAGQAAGIPQTSLFSFVVNDDPAAPYFDAYTVRGNAVIRISLPCGDTPLSSPYNGGDCNGKAQQYLESAAGEISQSYPR